MICEILPITGIIINIRLRIDRLNFIISFQQKKIQIPIVIKIACGLAPMPAAMCKPIGAKSAQLAVLDINWVNPAERMKHAVIKTYGLVLSPTKPITALATILPAPV